MQRIRQRFSHFQKAFFNLKEIKDNQNRIFSTLEKEGIIQRFEVLVELSWKIIKDFLETEGFMIKSPKDSIRKAFEYGLLSECEKWLQALEIRNITSHTYTEQGLDENLAYILNDFYPLVCEVYEKLENLICAD